MKKISTPIPRPSRLGTESETLLKALSDAATADSLALFHINNVVRLAAFACEARRTLQGIDDVLQYQPDVRESIADRVPAARNWTAFDDVASDVLQNLSTQIQALSESIDMRCFEVPKSSGGAA